MIVLNLVGGLGNQLFQMAFTLSVAEKNEKIIVEYGLGKTRLLPSGLPEIAAYNLPQNVELSFRSSRYSQFLSRCIGFSLRLQNLKSAKKSIVIKSKLSLKITNCLLDLYYRKNLELICPDDLGFFEFERSENMFISGYFQSHIWSSQVQQTIHELAKSTEYLNFYQTLAKIEKPIVVHVRRGDYRTEDTFGLLGEQYYREGINYILDNTDLRNIWLFSDEPRIAEKLLDQNFNSESIRVIPDLPVSSAALLEIMSLGEAFVIANSTFSWWAAFKSKSDFVVAPMKWFKAAKPPSQLLPGEWHKINSYFE